MKRQLQGIALILFGIFLLILGGIIDPWIPIVGDAGRVLVWILTGVSEAAGLILALRGEK